MATLTIPTANAAFSDQTTNPVSSISAATKFYPSGLTHHWPLEGDASDVVGTADGTVTGTTSVPGRVDNALEFDEIDDRITFPDFTYAPSFTMTFDFKLDSNAGSLFKYVYSHDDVNLVNSISIFINESSHGTDPDVLRTVARDSNDTLDNTALQVDISALVGDGLWHTYALVADTSAGLSVYIDGALAASDPSRGTDGIDPVGSAYLGARQDVDPDRFYGGAIDTVQIYGRALLPAEIAAQAS